MAITVGGEPTGGASWEPYAHLTASCENKHVSYPRSVIKSLLPTTLAASETI